MSGVLILFAHPRFEKSKTNRALLTGIEHIPGVTLHDLYEEYPDFNIDVARERALLSDHDVIVWHFPFFVYSAPALLKQWLDWVLEHGWAHGSHTRALQGKIVFVALTIGGARAAYEPGGYHRFTIRDFLVPFEQTAALCRMAWLPPFAVHGTHLLTKSQLAQQAEHYQDLLKRLVAGGLPVDVLRGCDYLNDWLAAEGQRGQP